MSEHALARPQRQLSQIYSVRERRGSSGISACHGAALVFFRFGLAFRRTPIRGLPDADVAPDESWAVYPQYMRSDTNLTVVEY